MKKVTTSFIFRLLVVVALATSGLWLYMHHNWLWLCLVVPLFFVSIYWFHRLYTYNTRKVAFLLDAIENVNPEKPDVPLNKNDAFQKVQKRRVQEKR